MVFSYNERLRCLQLLSALCGCLSFVEWYVPPRYPLLTIIPYNILHCIRDYKFDIHGQVQDFQLRTMIIIIYLHRAKRNRYRRCAICNLTKRRHRARFSLKLRWITIFVKRDIWSFIAVNNFFTSCKTCWAAFKVYIKVFIPLLQLDFCMCCFHSLVRCSHRIHINLNLKSTYNMFLWYDIFIPGLGC